MLKTLQGIFEINVGSKDSMEMVWEASKAYIRGKIIAQTSRRKRESIDKIKKLEAELSEMEKELAKHYSESLFKNICECKFKIHDIYNKKSEYALFRLKTMFYESGRKLASF